MAKAVYVGVGGVARKVKKGYVGVSGVARKIKKGYVGVGGVARLFFGAGETTYYGTATSLPAANDINGRRGMSAGKVSSPDGVYALYCMRYSPYQQPGLVAYNSSLTQSTKAFPYYTAFNDTFTVGDYAVLNAAWTDEGISAYGYAYNASLTATNLSNGVGGKYRFDGEKYAIVSGGTMSTYSKNIYAYSASLSRSTLTSFTYGRENYDGATNSKYYIIAGGATGSGTSGSVSTTAEAYNSSLTKISSVPSLPSSGLDMQASHTENYIIFTGGVDSYAGTNLLDTYAYGPSLTVVTAPSLSIGRRDMGCLNFNETAVFAGGYYFDASTTKYKGVSTVEAYSDSLTKSTLTSLSVARQLPRPASVGNYLLFAGGTVYNTSGGSEYSTIVNVYKK